MSTVLLADSDFPDQTVEREALAGAGLELAFADSGDPETLRAAAPDAVGLLVQWTRVNAAVLEALPSLRAVGRLGVGLDGIDLEEAERRGIPVVHSGDYATEEVAAHTLALALAALRRLPAGDRAVRDGSWTGAGHFRGMRRLSSLRAGVVGLGRIGRRVAALLSALGLDVAGYDPEARPPEVRSIESLDDLLARSDLVTLHVPLTASTSGLVDARRLELMPAGGVLVNAARGGLVDERALLEALRSGRLAAAALDVFEREPLGADHPLCGRKDVILSPHVGYFSEQALLEARTNTVTGLVAALRGERPRFVANPQVLERPRPEVSR